MRTTAALLTILFALVAGPAAHAEDEDAPDDTTSPAEPAAPDAPTVGGDASPAADDPSDAAPPVDAPDLDLATWRDAEVRAFAVARADGTPSAWITDPAIIAAFARAIPASHAIADGEMATDEGLTAYVRTADGKVFDVELIDVDRGGGWVELDDALVPVGAELAAAIGRGLGTAEFSSTSIKSAGSAPVLAASGSDLVQSYSTRGTDAHTLVLWQDKAGDSSSEAYGKELAKEHDHVLSVGMGEPAAMFRTIKATARAADACFDNVVVIGHGSPASMVLRAATSSTGASRMGYGKGYLAPRDFGRALKPFLCGSEPRVQLMSCRVALWAGGKQFIKDLAAGSGATVTAADNYVIQHGDSTHVEVQTPGSLWIASPTGGLSEDKQAAGNRWTHKWAAVTQDDD